MIELSATVTSGEGSEKHNHSINYRSKTLTHTHDTSEETVKELIPYEKTYQEQINELMEPYIREYNNSRDAKLKEAWKRFDNGEIQRKPKQKDYKHMDFDYYTFEQERKTKNKKTGKYEQKPEERKQTYLQPFVNRPSSTDYLDGISMHAVWHKCFPFQPNLLENSIPLSQ